MAQITRQIGTSSSDGFSSGTASDTDGSSSITIGTDYISLGRSGSNYYQAGFRFENITINSGSTITNAYMRLMGYGINNGPQYNFKITAEDVDNPGVWTTDHRPGTGGSPGRGPETTAQVDWDPTSIAGVPTWTNTPDISAVVQELIDRAGWTSGNAMCYIIRNDGGTLQGRVYDRNYTATARYARIVIDYTPLSGQVIIFE
jgi:hypothetical protein